MNHSIIDKPWQYKIISFHYECSSENPLEHYIELVMKKGDDIRKLKFLAPRQLEIGKDFPMPTGGIREILDIRDRGWENINIEVSDFECSNGAITFFAKDVIDNS